MTRLSHSEMVRLNTFEQRFEYLKLRGTVGTSTFGFDRWINQAFYKSAQWKHIRSVVIARDNGCDLGADGHPIHDRVLIHHMNPMRPEDFEEDSPDNLNPEYLITVSHRTHNAIHYGDARLLPKPYVPRRPGDTQLW